MSDLEFSDEEEVDLGKNFTAATKYVGGNVEKFEEGKLLELYGFYKQATVGDCEGSRPGIFQLSKRAKWDAWNKVRKTSKQKAMEKYVEIVQKSSPDIHFSQSTSSAFGSKSWVSVSTHRPDEADIDDENKTIFDHVQDKNFPKFIDSLDSCSDVNTLDDNGLSVLHWAADRGQDEMLRVMLKRPEVNVNVLDEDGQTPLHYAAFCGHPRCAQILLDAGADETIKDSSGQTCYDVACDEGIKALLTK
ncbi:Acyl-CoA-binding domain-containing protein 6 [Sergentomyia squamirostris]